MANVKISLSSDKEINKTNIYSDVDMTSTGLEKTLKDRKAVENSIRNILEWRPRERILNPGFGNTLWSRIFENFTSFTPDDIRSEVKKMLSYEPRINIEEILVESNVNASEIYVSFSYYIPDLETSSSDKTLNSYSITISNS